MVAIFIFSHIFSQEFNNGWTENGEQACPHSSNYLWELIWIPLCDNPYVPIPWLFELENTFFNCYILLKYYISYWLLFLQKAVKHWARTHFWKSIERCQEKMRKKVAIVPFSLLTVRAGVLHCSVISAEQSFSFQEEQLWQINSLPFPCSVWPFAAGRARGLTQRWILTRRI